MRKEIKIGLTVLAGLVLLYLAIAWTKSLHFFAANRNNFEIVFQDVAGLKEGDPVTVFGYPSGNVEGIRLENTGAIVTINLRDDVVVKKDAQAEIRVKELMGGKLIALTPGLATANLASGERINGSTSLDFSSAFAKAGEFLDKFDADKVDDIVNNVSRIAESFAKVAEEIDSMDTGALLEDVNQSADRLNGILAQVEQKQLVADIDNSLARINELADNADRTLNSFGDLADKVSDKTLPSVDQTLEQMNTLLKEADEMVDVLSDLTKQMKNQSTLAGKILYDEEMALKFDDALFNLIKTMEHVRTKKIHVSMAIGKKQKIYPEDVEGE